MAKEKEQLDLFGNVDTATSDIWGLADDSDPFGDSKNEDPFAFLPKEEPQKEDNKVVSLKNSDKTSTKKETKSAAKGKETVQKAKPAPKPVPVPGDELVDGEWTIAYAGHQVTPDQEKKLEDVRADMEIDFPELSKERTKWIIEKERKLAIPVVSGAKNG